MGIRACARAPRRSLITPLPEIENGSDVDYLGAQGYWVCTLVALVSVVFLAVSGKPVTGVAILLFYKVEGGRSENICTATFEELTPPML